MEATATERICQLVVYCPDCGGARRGVSLKRAILIEQLERDGDVGVISVTCGHARTLTADEKKNLRKALAEGVL